MPSDSITALREAGQSVWLDYLSRDIIKSGELARLVEQEGVTGVTSNPTIFRKAIEAADVYDPAIKELVEAGETDEKEIYLDLTMQDVGWAADILMPVYQATGGRDGFVSIEVSPDIANDTAKTIEEAKHLFETIGRKNVLVKVPATSAGIPAIEDLTAEGVNVNVTLLFSVRRYEKTAEAYINGLARRAEQGKPVEGIVSVASFFVSRLDTLVDKLLDEKLPAAGSEVDEEKIASVYGKVAVANSKLAYRKYREIFFGEQFHTLREHGAGIQTLLWGSTGTKNPKYSDVKYVDELVAPDTINTMPADTLEKFAEHGRARVTINDDLPGARAVFGKLSSLGINMDTISLKLEEEGVFRFLESYLDVLEAVGKKRDRYVKRAA